MISEQAKAAFALSEELEKVSAEQLRIGNIQAGLIRDQADLSKKSLVLCESLKKLLK